MTKVEEIVTKVSRDLQKLKQLVTGNGTPEGSLNYRIKILEDDFKEIIKRLEEIINRPCREPCIYEEVMEKEENVKEKHRTFRIGDIANVIQLIVLVLLAYGMFIK